MTVAPKTGANVIGVIFLAVGAMKFFTGGGWIVWIILGVLFGGLGIFAGKRAADQNDQQGGW